MLSCSLPPSHLLKTSKSLTQQAPASFNHATEFPKRVFPLNDHDLKALFAFEPKRKAQQQQQQTTNMQNYKQNINKSRNPPHPKTYNSSSNDLNNNATDIMMVES